MMSAAAASGLGTDNCISVPCDAKYVSSASIIACFHGRSGRKKLVGGFEKILIEENLIKFKRTSNLVLKMLIFPKKIT